VSRGRENVWVTARGLQCSPNAAIALSRSSGVRTFGSGLVSLGGFGRVSEVSRLAAFSRAFGASLASFTFTARRHALARASAGDALPRWLAEAYSAGLQGIGVTREGLRDAEWSLVEDAHRGGRIAGQCLPHAADLLGIGRAQELGVAGIRDRASGVLVRASRVQGLKEEFSLGHWTELSSIQDPTDTTWQGITHVYSSDSILVPLSSCFPEVDPSLCARVQHVRSRVFLAEAGVHVPQLAPHLFLAFGDPHVFAGWSDRLPTEVCLSISS